MRLEANPGPEVVSGCEDPDSAPVRNDLCLAGAKWDGMKEALMRLILLVVCGMVLGARGTVGEARAGTLVTMFTSVGDMELELYDEDKPVTVSNFLKYATSGLFNNLLLQRWEPNFVIQAGQYWVDTNDPAINVVPVYGTITNEFSVGKPYLNTAGTIAMARVGGQTNSASSQWFLNLTNSPHLDKTDGGFTVFGHVTKGTEVMNLFVPPSGTQGIWRRSSLLQLGTMPVLTAKAATNGLTLGDLILINFALRRDLGVSIAKPGAKAEVTWNAVAGATNTLEFADSPGGAWTALTNFVGDGKAVKVADPTSPVPASRLYRVSLRY